MPHQYPDEMDFWAGGLFICCFQILLRCLTTLFNAIDILSTRHVGAVGPRINCEELVFTTVAHRDLYSKHLSHNYEPSVNH